MKFAPMLLIDKQFLEAPFFGVPQSTSRIPSPRQIRPIAGTILINTGGTLGEPMNFYVD